MIRRKFQCAFCVALVCAGVFFFVKLLAQEEKLNSFDRDRAKEMLREVEDDVKKPYYDPKFHGIDLNARFHKAEDKINSATSMNHALSEIPAALGALNDSHTFFIPPPRPYTHSYGWIMRVVGDDKVFVTAVRPDSDAATKGVKPGDQVLSVNGFVAKPEDLWKMNYVFNILRPQLGLRLELRSPDGATRQVDTIAKMTEKKKVVDLKEDLFQLIREDENQARLERSRFVEFGKGVIVLKQPNFDISPDEADRLLDKVRARENLVLDLRGNPGGLVESLEKFLGGIFDHDVKIADKVARKPQKPLVAKQRGGKTFTGALFVLIDNNSASAAELFARTVQIEKRGKILGDRSSGSVMESLRYSHQWGIDVVTFYGDSITEADLIMADGKSLEHAGVMPDERILPTAADLAAGRDPVMSRALELAGHKISPEEAGKMFPLEWSKD